jgi:hypothetical protein
LLLIKFNVASAVVQLAEQQAFGKVVVYNLIADGIDVRLSSLLQAQLLRACKEIEFFLK